MSRPRFLIAAALLGIGCLFVPLAQSQPTAPKGKAGYRLEPVADTKLIMEGLASPNLRGLGKVLADKPADAEAWGFARGQALLIAETGNLLLLRPPKSAGGEELWMKHAAELRDARVDAGAGRGRQGLSPGPAPGWRAWPTPATGATKRSASATGSIPFRSIDRRTGPWFLTTLERTSSLSRDFADKNRSGPANNPVTAPAGRSSLHPGEPIPCRAHRLRRRPERSPSAVPAAKREITLISHSMLFYWWPIWVVGPRDGRDHLRREQSAGDRAGWVEVVGHREGREGNRTAYRLAVTAPDEIARRGARGDREPAAPSRRSRRGCRKRPGWAPSSASCCCSRW